MAAGYHDPGYFDEGDNYGYVYPPDDYDDGQGGYDDWDDEPEVSYSYDGEGEDGDIEINDGYWDDEVEELWEEEYPESWIPYAAESPAPDPAGGLQSAVGPGNSQQVIVGAALGMYPNPAEVSAHWCGLYPEVCAARPIGRVLPVRNNTVTGNGTVLGEAGAVDGQAKGLPILRYVDFSGLGLAVILIVVVLLALNLGWDSEVSGESCVI